jgi:hypothetical protein
LDVNAPGYFYLEKYCIDDIEPMGIIYYTDNELTIPTAWLMATAFLSRGLGFYPRGELFHGI